MGRLQILAFILAMIMVSACSNSNTPTLSESQEAALGSATKETTSSHPSETTSIAATLPPESLSLLQQAIEQTKQITQYRIDYVGPSANLFPVDYHYTAMINGENIDYTSVPIVNGQERSIEHQHFRMVEGKLYVEIPDPATKDPDTLVWIEIKRSASSTPEMPNEATPRFFTEQLLDAIFNQQVDLNQFRKESSEVLDDQACDLYSANKQAAIQALLGVAKMRYLNTPQVEGLIITTDLPDGFEIKEATLQAWVCSDLYLHKIVMVYETSSEETVNTTQKRMIFLDLFDINKNIDIPIPSIQTRGN